MIDGLTVKYYWGLCIFSCFGHLRFFRGIILTISVGIRFSLLISISTFSLSFSRTIERNFEDTFLEDSNGNSVLLLPGVSTGFLMSNLYLYISGNELPRLSSNLVLGSVARKGVDLGGGGEGWSGNAGNVTLAVVLDRGKADGIKLCDVDRGGFWGIIDV